MDAEGYPTKAELNKIKTWDCYDAFSLIHYVRGLWNWSETYSKVEWIDNAFGDKTLELTLCTGGRSGNEDIINALLSNTMFSMLWYESWHRGGKYVFHVTPSSIGYLTEANYLKKYGVTLREFRRSKDSEFLLILIPIKNRKKPLVLYRRKVGKVAAKRLVRKTVKNK
jgi:hypothetical protein